MRLAQPVRSTHAKLNVLRQARTRHDDAVRSMDIENLIALLVRDGSDVAFSGLLEDREDDGTIRRRRVHRNGRLIRIEEPPGTVSLIAGHRTYWVSDDEGVFALPRSPGVDVVDLGMVTMGGIDPEGYWREWFAQDRALVESSVAPTTYEGRPAWRFDAPFVKGGVPTLTVDIELGIVVRAERPDLGVFHSWTDLRTDPPFNERTFRYDGPWRRSTYRIYPDGWLPE